MLGDDLIQNSRSVEYSRSILSTYWIICNFILTLQWKNTAVIYILDQSMIWKFLMYAGTTRCGLASFCLRLLKANWGRGQSASISNNVIVYWVVGLHLSLVLIDLQLLSSCHDSMHTGQFRQFSRICYVLQIVRIENLLVSFVVFLGYTSEKYPVRSVSFSSTDALRTLSSFIPKCFRMNNLDCSSSINFETLWKMLVIFASSCDLQLVIWQRERVRGTWISLPLVCLARRILSSKEGGVRGGRACFFRNVQGHLR